MKGENVLRPGDVLITTGGTIGKTSMIPDDFDGAVESIATGNLTVARAKKGIRPEFLSSILGSPTYQNWLEGHARGHHVSTSLDSQFAQADDSGAFGAGSGRRPARDVRRCST